MKSIPRAQRQSGASSRADGASEGLCGGADNWRDKKERYTVRDKQEESGRAHYLLFGRKRPCGSDVEELPHH